MRSLKMKTLLSCFLIILYVFECSAQSSSEASLELNAPCMTPNDKAAMCISIYDCSVLYDQLTSAKQSTIDFLRASDCGQHQEVPLVCCGEDADYDEAHQTFGDIVPTRNRTKKPEAAPFVDLSTRFGEDEGIKGVASRRECGYMVEQDRILNGLVTSIDEFPWMALLQYGKRSDGARRFLCGGSLIGNRYVLTAAHCVTGEIRKNYRLIGVRLGEFNIQEERDCVRFKNYVECADPPLNVGIERVMPHPNFDESRREKPNDIALIRLDRDISYTDYIRPICLPTVYDHTAVGKHLIVAGWGRTESAISSAVKLKLSVPLTSRRYCRNTFRKAGANIQDSQICAGGERGRDSCTGDSGGPLMTGLPDNPEQWYIEGIVSFGTVCGMKGWPGVYTRVNAYLDWINQNVI